MNITQCFCSQNVKSTTAEVCARKRAEKVTDANEEHPVGLKCHSLLLHEGPEPTRYDAFPPHPIAYQLSEPSTSQDLDPRTCMGRAQW